MTSTPEPTSPSEEATTAAGLDVAETDDFLYSLFVPRFLSMWKYLGADESLSPHRLLWIQALLKGATLWITSGQTPATTALGLKAVETGSAATTSVSRRQERVTIAKWILLSVLLPTMYRQLRLWYDSSISLSDADEDPVVRLARERKRSLVRAVLDTVDRTVPALRLYALLAWWMGKRGSAPGLAMTLAGMSLVSTRPPQRLHVNYAHRRWLYEELVRTMQMVAPFSSWQDFSSCYTGLVRPVKDSWERMIRQRGGASSASRCPICRSDPITVPYETNCGHVYCYSCLWNATSNNDRYPCRVCRHIVSSTKPYLVPTEG